MARPLSALPAELRARCRDGSFRGTTSGLAPGFAQANLVVLPGALAADFRRFCERNPRPCPLLHDAESGADFRTDLPRYVVRRRGASPRETLDATADWRDDFVPFLLGCSFGFEAALVEAGIPLRHRDQGRIVPMYATRRRCEPAGRFRAPLVVTMRPIPRRRVADAIAICRDFPLAHGPPVHVGDPAELGIADLARPDWGDDCGIGPDDVPVFWACGVTSQLAVEAADAEVSITHAPGHMFVTDLPSRTS